MNLIRLSRNGKKDDYCEYVELLTLDGKIEYANIRALNLTEKKHRASDHKKHFPFWVGNSLRTLTTMQEGLLTHREVLCSVIMGKQIDLSRTVKYE